MKIYRMTDVGESEASSPVSNPSSARKVLYYLRRRSNHAASDDMICDAVFSGDKSQTNIALNRLLRANAIEAIR